MRIHPITLLGISAVMIAHLSAVCGATPVLRVGFYSWVGFAGVFAAVDQGFFEKEGVTIELRSFPGPTDTIPPTIAGDLDIALTTPDNVMAVDAGQKADLVTIAVIDVSVGAAAMDRVADFQVAQQLYKVKPVIGTTLDSTFVRSASMSQRVRPPAPADWFHVFPIDERTYALS